MAAAISTHQGEGAYDRLLPGVEASTGREEPLLDEGFISQAREERLLELWVQKLKQELKDIDAPILGKRQGSLDPDRAANLLVGRTRASTLKRHLTHYKHWRLWLGEAKLRMPRGRPADLVDYLLNRRDEPCGRTVPEALLKAIAWVEDVAEFPWSSGLRTAGLPGPLRTGLWRSCRRGHFSPREPHAIPPAVGPAGKGVMATEQPVGRPASYHSWRAKPCGGPASDHAEEDQDLWS